MRIRQVRACAFGPFEDAELELAPGMTVITGPNEAGKSTWHAAIYVGLCGMRRGRGRPQREDEVFAARHKPWDGDSWEVEAVVELPGRTVELHHDLSGRVDCRARDLTFGTDVSNEIIQDGSPDGSTWLGLDRRTFLAVACVRQAEILAVTTQADALQDHLQRAASTGGTDETASAALGALRDFRSEHVGTLRANSSRPWMRARIQLQQAQQRRAQAERDHEEWLELTERVSQLESSARRKRLHLVAAEARQQRIHAEGLLARAVEARELAARFPDRPAELRDDDDLADRVASALDRWERRPTPTAPTGPTVDELQAQLDALPAEPIGDLDEDPEVDVRFEMFRGVQAKWEAHRAAQPADPGLPSPAVAAESELFELARRLEATVQEVDPALRAEVEHLRREANDRPGLPTGAWGLTALGGVLLLIGIGLLAAGQIAAAALVLAVGVAAAGAGGARVARNYSFPRDVAGLHAAEARLAVAEQLEAAARREREAAVARVGELGVPADPSQLRAMADSSRQAARSLDELRKWRATESELTEQRDRELQDLTALLRSKSIGVAEAADVDAIAHAVAKYREECSTRRAQAAELRRRPDIEQSLAARAGEDRRFEADKAAVLAARQALASAANGVGTEHDSLSDDAAASVLANRLTEWQQARQQWRQQADAARQAWARLDTLLAGNDLSSLEGGAERANARADELEQLARDAPAVDLGADPERTIASLRTEAADAEQQVHEARTELQVRSERLISMPEAEEELAAAQAELDRVESLNRVLELTENRLASAQERVHRDIAPRLQAKLRDRLVRVTAGRYTDVIVDPQTLGVQVRDPSGRWRNASLLSHGTAEQVYLLLRIAMAEILTAAGTRSPLLLDDVTVQADTERTHCDVGSAARGEPGTPGHRLHPGGRSRPFGRERRLGERDALVRLCTAGWPTAP
jgi:DNA repair protein SbcC/Rad50